MRTPIEIASEMVAEEIPYCELGFDPETGLFCLGVVREFFKRWKDIEIDVPVSADRESVLGHDWMNQFEEVTEPRDGDCCRMMPTDGADHDRHVGVIVRNSVLHVHERLGVIMTSRLLLTLYPTYYRLRGDA